jgi:L-ascorbate metabolism protein UlaG (beta-lactamase superfamily)
MQAEYEGITFERPGHATVRIETAGGTVIYVDPWSEVIGGAPGDADVVFVTHDDMDHYDPDGIRVVSNAETTVAAYEAIETADVDRAVTPLPRDGEVEVAGIGVRTLPAYNRSDGDHVRDDGSPFHAEGEVIGLLLSIDGVSVYFTSDTDALDALRDVDADVVLPPIGGSYTMDRHEAADLVASIGPALVLPVHYDMDAVPGLDTDAAAFEAEVEAAGPRVVRI